MVAQGSFPEGGQFSPRRWAPSWPTRLVHGDPPLPARLANQDIEVVVVEGDRGAAAFGKVPSRPVEPDEGDGVTLATVEDLEDV